MTSHTDALILSLLLQRGIIVSRSKLHEEVRCDNYTNPVAEIAQRNAEVSGESDIITHTVWNRRLEKRFVSIANIVH